MSSFIIWLKLPDRQRIGIDSDKLLLTPENSMPEIVLRSKPQGAPIAGANELVLCGNGYSSEKEALTQGEQLKDVLILALSHSHIGADFGDRAPRGCATDYCLRMLEQGTGKRVLNYVPGVMTFETESAPLILRAQTGIVMTHVQKKFEPAFHRAFQLRTKLRPADRLAFDLFSASFFETSADARLLMLMMAVETLLDPSPRSNEAKLHVDELIRLTKDSPILSKKEKKPIISSLEWLYKESIGQAGRKLADRLGGRRYMNKTAKEFFTYCYGLRSALVHGNLPRPKRDDIDLAAANLESFVGDLLSGPLL